MCSFAYTHTHVYVYISIPIVSLIVPFWVNHFLYRVLFFWLTKKGTTMETIGNCVYIYIYVYVYVCMYVHVMLHVHVHVRG